MSVFDVKISKTNQYRHKYAFMHRYHKAYMKIINEEGMSYNELDMLLVCYSYSSFSMSEMNVIAGKPKTSDIFNTLEKNGYIKNVRKKRKANIYVMTRSTKEIIEQFYDMLLGRIEID